MVQAYRSPATGGCGRCGGTKGPVGGGLARDEEGVLTSAAGDRAARGAKRRRVCNRRLRVVEVDIAKPRGA